MGEHTLRLGQHDKDGITEQAALRINLAFDRFVPVAVEGEAGEPRLARRFLNAGEQRVVPIGGRSLGFARNHANSRPSAPRGGSWWRPRSGRCPWPRWRAWGPLPPPPWPPAARPRPD